MKYLFSFLLSLLLLPSFAMANDDFYRLGVGDQIRIQVYDEPELSFETRVSDNGNIDYPFLGKIRLKGKTLEEVKIAIHDGLQDGYLINPNVSVSILEYRPFFVNGQVMKPGSYPFHPGLSVNQAITIAGGFTERASKTSLFVSSSDDPEAKQLKVTLLSKLQPGDILTVAESFF
ncbi:exopolysaccharide export protein VpsN [Vibrio metoecus]|uniref:exopolysaccharide export protein VpsN n=1 Tax=Vibrio metoecus TaxID=1481663 RepID=UPI0006D7D093|nr:exopolysaccharide export protein VpsN [Vibrio metoecus]KQA18141.1 polysaccharide biosynthesis/export family protein [Vibrio metoecus]